MNAIKGTPAYWKKFLREVLAMMKQLGMSTFFLTFSCADLRWNDIDIKYITIKMVEYFKGRYRPNVISWKV